MSACPVCGTDVELAGDEVVGELISCESCGGELEILNLSPLQIGEAPSDEEDWDQ